MKANWIEGAYGYWRLTLPGGFVATVGWDSITPRGEVRQSGYIASFESIRLPRPYASLDEAKRAAERLARVKLTAALDALPGPTAAEAKRV